MFIGREKELAILEEKYREERFHLFILYGRRRVGKTTLLKHFCGGKPTLFFVGEENNDKLSLKRFSEAILNHFGMSGLFESFETWEKAFRFLIEHNQSRKMVLVLDEFPYLARANPALPSLLQRLADGPFKESGIFLVLCGSSMSFMEKEVLSYKSPLYGRRTGSLVLEPFDFYDSIRFFERFSQEDLFKTYAILGGIPQYLESFDDSISVAENIKGSILQKGSLLYEEPRFMTMQELRNPIVYNSIIEAIADGYTRLNQIADKVGEASAKTAKYLNNLLELRVVERVNPVDKTEKSRKSLYRIKDNLFRFYYYFITKNYSLLEQGMVDYVYSKLIEPRLTDYLGKAFEQICIEYLKRKNTRLELPFVFKQIGTWWGPNPQEKREEEIDILAISGQKGLFGECKWRNKLVDMPQFKRLEERSRLLPYDERAFFLFSKSGFTEELKRVAGNREDVFLIAYEDMLDHRIGS